MKADLYSAYDVPDDTATSQHPQVLPVGLFVPGARHIPLPYSRRKVRLSDIVLFLDMLAF